MCKKAYPSLIAVVVAIIVCVLFAVNFRVVFVDGQSMEPTLKARQLVLVKRDVSSVQREDIVVFCINQSVYIKRIVAVAGDTVQLTDCRVYVNGVYVYPYTCDIDSQIEYHLEEGQYFVLGDNGEASIDSRDFGVISENAIAWQSNCILARSNNLESESIATSKQPVKTAHLNGGQAQISKIFPRRCASDCTPSHFPS